MSKQNKKFYCKYIQTIVEVKNDKGELKNKRKKTECRFNRLVKETECIACLINRNTIILENGFTNIINLLNQLLQK